MRRVTRCAIASLAMVFSAKAQAQIITSGFDSGLQGWTGTGGVVSWISTGGNPGGYLQQVDNLNTYMTVFAPSAFLGNLSAFLGGSLSFDVRNVDGAADLNSAPLFGTVTITGTSGSSSRMMGGTGEPPVNGPWKTYSSSLTAADWSGNLASVLNNVTEISFVLEFNNQILEIAAFDNPTLRASTVVPEPSSLALLAVGLGMVGAGVRAKSRR